MNDINVSFLNLQIFFCGDFPSNLFNYKSLLINYNFYKLEVDMFLKSRMEFIFLTLTQFRRLI